MTASARGARGAVAALALVLVASGVAGVEAAEPVAGGPVADAPVVARVEVRSDVALDALEQIPRLITVEEGERLGGDAVAASIRNLHAIGSAGQIEVYARPAGVDDRGRRRVDVVFVLWAQVTVEEVELVGDLGLRSRRLRGVLAQRAAQPLIEDRVLRSVYRLSDLYREEGYLEARVRLEVDVDEKRKRARVVFHVEAGKPATVGEVAFAGELGPLSRDRLLQPLSAASGARYRQSKVTEDREALRRWLIGQGYRTAEVDGPAESYDPDAREMDLTYHLEVGPKVRLELTGAEAEKLGDDDLLPFLGPEGYDEGLVLQAVSALKTHYQEQGRYRVEIDWREERTDGELVLHLEIDRGPVLHLESLAFQGNETVTAERCSSLMTTSPRRRLVPGSGRLVDATLKEDLANLRSYFALEGYTEVEVSSRVDERDGELHLTVVIEQGRRRMVDVVTIEGMEALDEAAVRRDLPIEGGGPYHPRRLEEALDRIRSRYEDAGYDFAQVSATRDWNEERTIVSIHVRVLEGVRSEVGRVVVRGNRDTHTEALLTWVDLERGEPVSTRRLLEVQRRLYRVGVFSRVDVSVAASSRFASERTVVVRVEEGRHRRLFYGVGWDSEDGVRGLVGYSHSNLFGRGVTGQVDLRASQRERQFRALLRQPFVGARETPVTYSLFRVEEEEESFDSLRQGLQVEADRQLGDVQLGLFLNLRQVELSDLDPGLEEIEIDRDLREVQITSITPTLFIDRRDDPLLPSQGWSVQLQLEYAFELFQGDAQFLKAFTQQTAYLDLGGFGVVGGSLRLGAIEPFSSQFDDPTVPDGLASAGVPISERFFAGGRTSHRAYERDRLGIGGETLLDRTPIGGDGLLLVNLDYRYPITETIGATLFVDAGNVWADWRAFDPGQIKSGIGVGGRYVSFLGPLRLEVGWKLDREPGEDPWVIFLSFGNPF